MTLYLGNKNVYWWYPSRYRFSQPGIDLANVREIQLVTIEKFARQMEEHLTTPPLAVKNIPKSSPINKKGS